MKVVMVNYWSDSNKGDCAMALGTITAFKRSFPDVQFTVSPAFWHKDTRFSDACRHIRAVFPDVQIISSDLPVVENEALLRRFPGPMAAALARPWWLSHIARSLPSLALGLKHTPLLRSIAEADLVLSSPGSYFFVLLPGLKPMLERLLGGMYAHAYPLLAARRMGKPFALYSQTVGPFHGNRPIMAATRRLLQPATFISVREEGSKAELLKCGVEEHRVHVFPDASFGVAPSPPERVAGLLARYGLRPGQFMALTVRPWSFYGEALYQRYLDTMAQAVDALLSEGTSPKVAIVLMSTMRFAGEDDLEAAEALRQRVQAKDRVVIVTEDMTPPDISALYGQARFLVGTRAHSLILASLSGTPSVGISYWGHKTHGFTRMLGLEEFTLNIRELDTQGVLNAVHRLLDNEASLRAGLMARTAQLRERACTLPGLIMEAGASSAALAEARL
ncbi:MAG: polysaccharide pyruvyl transferase family protein [Chloroflexi bacterium]|nr:polysaccharide pyruvyl transferase family protein [Chloroflexota bacterium]